MDTLKNYRWIISHANNAEHFYLYNSISAFIKGREMSEVIVPLWKRFALLFERENDVYKRSPKAVETKYVKAASALRRREYMSLRRGIESGLYSSDHDTLWAAGILSEILDKYKGVYRASMITAGALVRNMVGELFTERYYTPLVHLGLKPVAERLRKANEDFNAIYDERMQSNERASKKGGMADVRPLVDRAFREFVKVLESMHTSAVITGSGGAKPLQEIIDAIIASCRQLRLVYNRRTGRASRTDTPADALPTPTPAAAATLTYDHRAARALNRPKSGRSRYRPYAPEYVYL
ncbi:MAG: DUF6261 family protein [Tannerellaceae bacterium]|nr:DUF6261 family protein [Tannerellaceae bacterium]